MFTRLHDCICVAKQGRLSAVGFYSTGIPANAVAILYVWRERAKRQGSKPTAERLPCFAKHIELPRRLLEYRYCKNLRLRVCPASPHIYISLHTLSAIGFPSSCMPHIAYSQFVFVFIFFGANAKTLFLIMLLRLILFKKYLGQISVHPLVLGLIKTIESRKVCIKFMSQISLLRDP